MAQKFFTIAIALSCALVASVHGADPSSRIPGAQTASGIMASSANGMAQYFDQNGPIQPAVVALGTLTARGAEQINKALSSLSSGLYNQAQSLSQSSGQNGQIRMPGLQQTTSQLPESLSSMGQRLRDGIRRKNEWIMNRAQEGVDSSNRLGERMRTSVNDGGVSVKATGTLSSAVESGENMISNGRDSLMNGASQLQNHAQQQMSGLRQQMAPIGAFGQDLAGQMMDYSRTISNGLQGAAGELQQTGQQLISQMQTNHPRNLQSMSQIMNSLHSSLRSNLANYARQAQNLGQSAMEQARSFGRNGFQRAQDASKRAQELGQGAAQQAQTLGQNAAQQAQAFGQSAAQQAQTLGQNAAQQAQALGQSAAQQAQTLGQNAAQQAHSLSQSATQQLSNGIQSLVPSGLTN